jgi:hypothetical protein
MREPKELKIESIPGASKPDKDAEKSLTDRLPVPPNGNFFDRDATKKLLDGLEDLGNPDDLPPAGDPLLPEPGTPAVLPPSTGTSEDDLLSGYSPQSSPYFTRLRSVRHHSPTLP